MEGRATQMPLRELLLHLLEYTSTDVIDELWPDNATTLDEIAGQILRRDAHELAERVRAEKVRQPDGEVEEHVNHVIAHIADLIDPENGTP